MRRFVLWQFESRRKLLVVRREWLHRLSPLANSQQLKANSSRVNSPSYARSRCLATLVLSGRLSRGTCEMVEFCTTDVGPPRGAQFSNAGRERSYIEWPQNASCKMSRTPMFTHYCASPAKTASEMVRLPNPAKVIRPHVDCHRSLPVVRGSPFGWLRQSLTPSLSRGAPGRVPTPHHASLRSLRCLLFKSLPGR